jgi:hypothetical protein
MGFLGDWAAEEMVAALFFPHLSAFQSPVALSILEVFFENFRSAPFKRQKVQLRRKPFVRELLSAKAG